MKKRRIFIKSIYNEFRIFNSPIFISIKSSTTSSKFLMRETIKLLHQMSTIANKETKNFLERGSVAHDLVGDLFYNDTFRPTHGETSNDRHRDTQGNVH